MHNVLYMSPPVRAAFERFKHQLEPQLGKQTSLATRDADIFLLRLERYFADFYEPLVRLYGQRPDFESQLEAIGQAMLESLVERSEELRRLDLEREITPDWFQREKMAGGIYYVDLFAGSLSGLRQHLNYIKEMGLNYIHLMPLLKPREGANDGGYAVQNYCEVDPRLGTMNDLQALTGDLRANGISLCIDLVLNHTAKEHEWARQARAGDPEYLDYYFTYADRTIPDQYEKTLPEVFPDFKPGNFTYYPDMAKWVWTTFNEYQWDLNYTNPAVFRGMLNYMFYLANRGVDVLRLDAAPFIWKRLGTTSQNQPEVYDLLQAFRSIVRVVAPSVIFKAEAIVAPHELVHYLGVGRHAGKECDIAYNNSLMVLLWSALASRKVQIMTYSLREMPAAPTNATWITYVRCHDDIGWAVMDENAAAVGENGFLHRQFLNSFYSGQFPGSFARGEIFQYNPRTKDGRMNGMTASLAGLEQALDSGDSQALELAIQRILLLYSVVFSYGGIPLIYMGDELGLLNDYDYLKNPDKAQDSRWMHRPPMDWSAVERRHDPTSVTGRIYHSMRQLLQARMNTPQLHGSGVVEALWTDNQHVFAYLRQHASGRLLGLANFSEYPQSVEAELLWQHGLPGELPDASQPARPRVSPFDNRLYLAPYQVMWLVDEVI